MPVILILRRLKQEHSKFEASLGYIVRFYIKKKQENGGRKEIVVFGTRV
jgi:hypothetical protein